MVSLTKAKAAELANNLAARLGPIWEPRFIPYVSYSAVLKGSISGANASIQVERHGKNAVFSIRLVSGPFTIQCFNADPTLLLQEAMGKLDEKIEAARISYEHLACLAK